eukprot:136014-Prymnesium_polylepis.1
MATHQTARRAQTRLDVPRRAQTSYAHGTSPDAQDVPRREPDVNQTCPRRPQMPGRPDACQTPARRSRTRPD